MREINPEHVKAIIELCNHGHYFRLLSMGVRELGRGYCRVEVELEDKHLNPFGGVHGGVYASLIDTAAYWQFTVMLKKMRDLYPLILKLIT